MRQFKNKHAGERCFILGNGPSLKDLDWSVLEGEVWFGTNRIYLSGHIPDYYVCVNPLVLSQFNFEIAALDTTKFISGQGPITDAVNLDTTLATPSFSSPEGPIWEGYTVTYVCLQLAFYMGFKEVILLGVDHYYGDVKQPNLEVVATGYDEHHFHPDYFSGGVRWNLPDLPRTEFAYTLAKHYYELANRKIINCTSRTKLEIFDLEPLNYAISNFKPRVSSIVSAYYAEDKMDGLIKDQIGMDNDLFETVIVCQKDTPECHRAHDFREYIGDMWCTIVETEDIPTIYRAWNLGIQFAKGKYLTNANTDDKHHPLAYKMMADVLDARPEIDVVYHDSYVTWEDQTYIEFLTSNVGKKLEPGRYHNKPGIFSWGPYTRGRLTKGCYMGPQPMWRANLHQRYGGFMDNLEIAGDYEFWLRVSKQANMMWIPYPFGLYRADLNGKELKNPELATEESHNSIYVHQSSETGITPVDDDTIRISIGDEWSYVNSGELYSMLKQLKGE